MHRFLASNIHNVPQSGLGKIWNKALELEQAGKEVIHFGIGRPDFDTPRPIKDAAIKAINDGQVHYTVTRASPNCAGRSAMTCTSAWGPRLTPTAR